MTTGGARAFAPGHVTVFFAPHWSDDPARTGSIGGGLTISEGVTVGVTAAETTRIRINGRDGAMDAVGYVLEELGVPAAVRIDTELPIGAGFGVSGAAALATALAGNHAAGGALSENELVRIAHCAEVRAGTGLGDVVAQARGGIPLRIEPGAPGFGALDGIPAASRLEYQSFGELPTAEILSGDTRVIREAGSRALERVRASPTLETLFAAGRAFARETGLLDPEIEAVVREVRDGGGEATMAMLGRTVVGLGTGLTDAGYEPSVARTHTGGASLVIE